jgi:wobble nucleotide-excising tRNase
MVHKITKIENFGRFLAWPNNKDSWNGVFGKNNVIYGDNGSGKSTLSLLFRSLKGAPHLMEKKKSFGSSVSPKIVLFNDKNVQINYADKKWNHIDEYIDVLDHIFIEDNVYIITIAGDKDEPNFFELLIGEESIRTQSKIIELKSERKKLANRRRALTWRLRKIEDADRTEIAKQLSMSQERGKAIGEEIKVLEKNRVDQALGLRSKYLTLINKFLLRFNSSFKITELNQKANFVIYGLQIEGFDVRRDNTSYSLKYSLSEGDKNALAISFFFAQLELYKDLDKRTIVIDDPITSFDSSRRHTTINHLMDLSSRVKKLIVLTHDINFANDLASKLGPECVNLKIVNSGKSNNIIKHNIAHDVMTGLTKDMQVLHSFIDNGIVSSFDLREVIRCIRPLIEGIFRIKYYGEINDTEWLGDFLSKIRNADEDSSFFRLKDHLQELSEINDYTKGYHHSSPGSYELPINESELRSYVKQTIALIKII